jgi:hypothetical protein
MLGRALSLAAVTLLIGCLAALPGGAQAQNLDAGKSPSQIFAGTCNACHKSPRGLLKTVSPGSLPGFLREHYTTSADMASLLSTFLISNGAGDAQRQVKQGADTKPAGGAEQVDRQGRRLRPGSSQEAARPDADGSTPGEAGRQGRNAKRLSRQGEAPDAGKPSTDGQAPAQAAVERGPDGRKLTAKERLRKRGRPGGEELPKADAVKDEPPKTEPLPDDKAKGEAAKEGNGTPLETKPADEGKSEAARIESPKEGSGAEAPAQRPDSVPAAPPAASTETSTATAPSAAPATAPSPAPEPAAARPPAPSEAPAAVTASAPRPAASPPPAVPATGAGPPAPPISQ